MLNSPVFLGIGLAWGAVISIIIILIVIKAFMGRAARKGRSDRARGVQPAQRRPSHTRKQRDVESHGYYGGYCGGGAAGPVAERTWAGPSPYVPPGSDDGATLVENGGYNGGGGDGGRGGGHGGRGGHQGQGGGGGGAGAGDGGTGGGVHGGGDSGGRGGART